ncbi:unnamed protein product [Aureobasidium mustum]|uniref:Purine nucleoside permease n=1 Tax=Aureobasidium mustum TaxID=2773714 RepID=A0A9N8K4W9_9PEZI|nr:unnamed protein product [Aureobasidium mustum]
MRFSSSIASALLGLSSVVSGSVVHKPVAVAERALEYVIKPKMVIISMFAPEAEIWYGIPEFNLLARNITLPGASPLFPDVHCTEDGDVCQVITGESEINAAVTIASLVRSPRFDLTTTYFMIAGIAGINPEVATICSVTIARYAVQYPQNIYGTEVFEATLNDSDAAIAYRALYAHDQIYAAGASPSGPSVVECDVATSDVYYSGPLLGEAFGNFTTLITNGTGNYCSTAQEDNATLEALLRAAAEKLVDFSRIIVMRTASDFDRPFLGGSATYNLFESSAQGAFLPAVNNLYLAGIQIGVNATNYIGDIFGTLGGEPDFGLGPVVSGDILSKRDVLAKRGVKSRRHMPVHLPRA